MQSGHLLLEAADLFLSALREWGISVSDSQLHLFDSLHRLLLQWNERFNLTRITEPCEVFTEHFLDSLAPLAFGLIGESRRHSFQPCGARCAAYGHVGEGVIDVGSGAGFPGIPLAICLPQTNFVLVEATRKKVAYLWRVAVELNLPNVMPLLGRAEELAREEEYRERFDKAVVRALGRLDVTLECSLPFVKVGGSAIAYKGPNVDEELDAGKRAAFLLGGEIEKVLCFPLPGTEIRRSLVIVRKLSPTPTRFPRRPGMPKKRPLGGLH